MEHGKAAVSAEARSASVDRDVPPALGGEGLLLPAAPAVLETQPSNARHQIELARPGVAGDDRRDTHSSTGQHHVALVETLRHGIMATDVEPHLANVDPF